MATAYDSPIANDPVFRAEPGVIGELGPCEEGWCQVRIGEHEGLDAHGHAVGGPRIAYSNWLSRHLMAALRPFSFLTASNCLYCSVCAESRIPPTSTP